MAPFDPFLAEWQPYATDPQYSLAEKSLKLAQLVEYPDLDITEYVGKLASLREAFRPDPSGEGGEKAVASLCSYVFDACGFKVSDDVTDLRAGILSDVIDARVGSDVAVSLVCSEIAAGAGLDLRILSFPGHVIAGCGELRIDPADGGRILSGDDLEKLHRPVAARFGAINERMLSPASPEAVLVSVVHGLKRAYMLSLSREKALRCALFALAIVPGSVPDIRDAGLVSASLYQHGSKEHLEGAIELLGIYLDTNPNGPDVDQILGIVRELKASR